MLNNPPHSISISQGGLIISLFECCISYLVRVSLIALACCRLWMFLHRTKTPRVKLGHSLSSVPASPVSTVPVLSGCNLQFITIYPAQPAQPSQPSPAQPGTVWRAAAAVAGRWPECQQQQQQHHRSHTQRSQHQADEQAVAVVRWGVELQPTFAKFYNHSEGPSLMTFALATQFHVLMVG